MIVSSSHYYYSVNIDFFFVRSHRWRHFLGMLQLCFKSMWNRCHMNFGWAIHIEQMLLALQLIFSYKSDNNNVLICYSDFLFGVVAYTIDPFHSWVIRMRLNVPKKIETIVWHWVSKIIKWCVITMCYIFQWFAFFLRLSHFFSLIWYSYDWIIIVLHFSSGGTHSALMSVNNWTFVLIIILLHSLFDIYIYRDTATV